jgi:hypothetical protein
MMSGWPGRVHGQLGLHAVAGVVPQVSFLISPSDNIRGDTVRGHGQAAWALPLIIGLDVLDHFDVETGVIYETLRHRFLPSDATARQTDGFSVELAYCKLPLQLQVNTLNPGKRFNLFCVMGFQLGFLVDAAWRRAGQPTYLPDFTLRGSALQLPVEPDYRVRDLYAPMVVDVVAGLGATWTLNRHLFLECGLRFQHAFTAVERLGYTSPSGQQPWLTAAQGAARRNVRTASAGLIFGLGYYLGFRKGTHLLHRQKS